MKNLLIRTRFFLLLAIFVAGLGVYGLLSFATLDQVKVEGPIYREIIRDKDLVADILPPPEYIIEPYLICHQLLSADAAQQPPLLDRLKALQRDYQQRHEFWRGQPLDPRLADLLLKQSHDPAVAFFALALERFVPALLAGERQAAQALMPRLDAEYRKHRLAIDEIVKIATERAASGEQRAAQEISTSTARLAAAFALSLAACIAVALLITRSIVGPLDAAVAIAKRFAGGDLGGRIDADGRSELAQLMAALREMQSSLSGVVARVRDDALWLAQASAEIAQGNHDLAGRTEAQAQSLAQTTASMTEFGDNVQHNADSARQASAVAAQASGIVEQAGRIVADVVSTMDEIDGSSRKIADIIVLIDSIAFQTNILALNAAVEAARAGEQGRGFAVVASEVQNLARRSASAAKEIKSLIDVSVAQVGKGNRFVGDAGRTMADVVATIRRVNDLMSEISAASSQQSLGVQQVGQAVAQMDEATQQNAAMVEQMASAASGLREQADSLVELVSVFKLDAAPTSHASAPG